MVGTKKRLKISNFHIQMPAQGALGGSREEQQRGEVLFERRRSGTQKASEIPVDLLQHIRKPGRSQVSPGHRGGIQGRWGSCGTAQCVSKPLALETQQRAQDTLNLTREILVS